MLTRVALIRFLCPPIVFSASIVWMMTFVGPNTLISYFNLEKLLREFLPVRIALLVLWVAPVLIGLGFLIRTLSSLSLRAMDAVALRLGGGRRLALLDRYRGGRPASRTLADCCVAFILAHAIITFIQFTFASDSHRSVGFAGTEEWLWRIPVLALWWIPDIAIGYIFLWLAAGVPPGWGRLNHDAAPRRRVVRRIILFVSALFVLLLLDRVYAFVMFPWDMIVESESPFMTNMMKIDQGAGVYGPPADSNSYIYPPALEYICFALLKPFDLHLDIRACRTISALIGLTGAILSLLFVIRVVRVVRPGGGGRSVLTFTFLALLLLIFNSDTSRTAHPDNLYLLHAVGTLLLCSVALLRRSFAYAICAMILAGLGVLTKQTAILAALGSGAALLLGNQWGKRRSGLLIAAGALSSAFALLVLLLPDYSRFYVFGLPASGPSDWDRLASLFTPEFLLAPHRVFLAMFAVFCLWRNRRSGDDRYRAMLLPWSLLGLTQVAVGLAAFVQFEAFGNNLNLLDLWLFLMAWPFVTLTLCGGEEPEAAAESRRVDPPSGDELRPPSPPWWGKEALARFSGRILTSQMAGIVFISVFLFALFPEPHDLDEDIRADYRELEETIGQDIRTGRRVLVGHGTMFLIRAGIAEPPLDRGASASRLFAGGEADLSPSVARIEDGYYDRIYDNYPAMPPELIRAMGTRSQDR